jgi:RIO-like serine/threonine protein kinase
VQAKGEKPYGHTRHLTLQEVVSELLEKDYLRTAPPEEEVKKVLDKMIREIEEAEARDHERVWRGRR